MLQRFHLYILLEILRLFGIALTVVTFVIMGFFLVQRLVMEGLGLFAILQLLPYCLPVSLQYSMPATLLFAVCSVFGRMSADNEIVAVKSAGISPLQVMTPVLILGGVLSPVAVWLNDIATSWGMPGMNRVVMHSLEEIVYRVLRTQKSYQTHGGGFTIYVKDVEGRWLISPVITILSQGDGQPQTFSADKARLELNSESEMLKVEFVNCRWEANGNSYEDAGGIQTMNFPLSRATRKHSEENRPGNFALSDIGAEIQRERAKMKSYQERLVAWCAMGTSIGRLSFFDDKSSRDFQWERDESQKRLYRLQTEPWRRWALGFSCFFFIWFGIPLAMWMKSADNATTFGACFFPILLTYYPVFGLGLEQAKDGAWPPYSVWLCNLVVFVLGALVMKKVYRY